MKLKNINALIRYEIINIKRSVLIWIMIALYCFGLQQAIYYIKYDSGFICLADFIVYSWVPLNFTMIPIMLLGIHVGESDNEVFRCMNITHREKVLSKIGVMSIITGMIFLVNIVVFIIIGIVCKVSLHYFLYESLGYIVNSLVFLIVSGLLGLFIGQVIGNHVGDAAAFLTTIALFLLLCNFYKLSNIIVPLLDMKMFASTFNVISYDKSYLYHNLFWITIAFIIFFITFMWKTNPTKNIIAKLVQKLPFILACAACIYLAANIILIDPIYYNIQLRDPSAKGNYTSNKHETFFCANDCGYSIDKYNMNITTTNKFKNNCNMEIKMNRNNVSSVEIGLYEKLNILSLKIDGKKSNFQRTNNSFIVNLPKKYVSGETLKMNVIYEGSINTKWDQEKNLFFVKNNEIFLADVFEWYPKLNDSKLKDYTINIKHNSKNKIYSNLDYKNKLNECNLQGRDREMCIVSGNISCKKYNGYLFIGNEEYINNNKKCNELMSEAKKINKIIFTPFIPGGTKMDINYEKAYLWSDN